MIPYEDLDRALARWKARSQNAAVDAAREFEAVGAAGATPRPITASASGRVAGLPAPADRTGEIDLADSVVESYEDDNR
jgi:hypothetical protein